MSVPLPAEQIGSPARTATAALSTILLAHLSVDALAAFAPATLGLLEARLGLTANQTAWLLGFFSFSSGLAQPVAAVVSDHLRSRWLGALGVGLAAVGIGAVVLAGGFLSLTLIYAAAAIGIGMFHPVGAAAVGQLRQQQRTSAVSLFFVSGMIGGVLGAFFWPRLVSVSGGLELVPWIVLPIVGLALVLNRLMSQSGPLGAVADVDPGPPPGRANWAMVGVLFASSCLRFCVNMALLYLYVRWIQGRTAAAHADWTREQIANASAHQIGNINASTIGGMALGGLLAGMLVRSGREKWPLVLTPILFAPLVVFIPYSPIEAGYALATLVGVGFASMIPVTVALAQQLLPHRQHLASSLMMGAAWAVAMVGPRCAEWGVAVSGLHTTFLLTAGTLVVSGLVCVVIPDRRLGDVFD